MARRVTKKTRKQAAQASRPYRKVTRGLPKGVTRESARDRRALTLVYAGAAHDPAFQADNEAVQRDFAAIDREAPGAG